jgi:hypothetical protein
MLLVSSWPLIEATSIILQHCVFFCGCRNGKTYASLTSQTGGLPSGKNYLTSKKAAKKLSRFARQNI